jgi:tRNA(fMet)-specific endonuclease VapC
MKYLLDTNICIYIIKQKPISVKQRFQSFDISDMGISIVTLGELEYGAAKSQNPSRNRSFVSYILRSLRDRGFESRRCANFWQYSG